MLLLPLLEGSDEMSGATCMCYYKAPVLLLLLQARQLRMVGGKKGSRDPPHSGFNEAVNPTEAVTADSHKLRTWVQFGSYSTGRPHSEECVTSKYSIFQEHSQLTGHMVTWNERGVTEFSAPFHCLQYKVKKGLTAGIIAKS